MFTSCLPHVYLMFTSVYQGRRPHIYLMFTSRFGDIWCRFVSFGPAPHIYQRGEIPGAVWSLKQLLVCRSYRTPHTLRALYVEYKRALTTTTSGAYRAGVGPNGARSDWQQVYHPLIRAREGAAEYAEPEMPFDDGLFPKLILA